MEVKCLLGDATLDFIRKNVCFVFFLLLLFFLCVDATGGNLLDAYQRWPMRAWLRQELQCERVHQWQPSGRWSQA